MLPISFEDITPEYLLDLPNSELYETESLEYKSEFSKWPGALHKSVCCFVNLQGGDLVIGVDEGEGDREGHPDRVEGLDLEGTTADAIDVCLRHIGGPDWS